MDGIGVVRGWSDILLSGNDASAGGGGGSDRRRIREERGMRGVCMLCAG